MDRVFVGPDQSDITAALPLELKNFDPADHKWIAVYLLGSADVLFNAADSDYGEQASALAGGRVVVREVWT